MKYEPCSICGGEVIDEKPHYIPMGTDGVLKIIDQKCLKCGAAIIGKNQKTKLYKNQEAHDKLVNAMRELFKKG